MASSSQKPSAETIRQLYGDFTLGAPTFAGLRAFFRDKVRPRYPRVTLEETRRALLAARPYALHVESRPYKLQSARDNVRSFRPGYRRAHSIYHRARASHILVSPSILLTTPRSRQLAGTNMSKGDGVHGGGARAHLRICTFTPFREECAPEPSRAPRSRSECATSRSMCSPAPTAVRIRPPLSISYRRSIDECCAISAIESPTYRTIRRRRSSPKPSVDIYAVDSSVTLSIVVTCTTACASE